MKRTRFALAAFFGTFTAAAQVVGFSYGQRPPVKHFEPISVRCTCAEELAELRSQGFKMSAGLMLPAARGIMEGLATSPIPRAQPEREMLDHFGYQEPGAWYGFNVCADRAEAGHNDGVAPNWSPLADQPPVLAKKNRASKQAAAQLNAKSSLKIARDGRPVEAPPVEVSQSSVEDEGATYEAALYDEFGAGGFDGAGYPFHEEVHYAQTRRSAAPAQPIQSYGSLSGQGGLNQVGNLHGQGNLGGTGNLGGGGPLSAIGPMIGVGAFTGHSRLTESGPLDGAGPLSVDGRLGGGGLITGNGPLGGMRQLNSGTLSGTGPLGGMGHLGGDNTLNERGPYNGAGNLPGAGPMQGRGSLNSRGPLQGQGQFDGNGPLNNGSWLFRGTGPVQPQGEVAPSHDPRLPGNRADMSLAATLQDPALSAGELEAIRINDANDGLHAKGRCALIDLAGTLPTTAESISRESDACSSQAVDTQADVDHTCPARQVFGVANEYRCPLGEECADPFAVDADPVRVESADAAEYDYDDTYGVYDSECNPYLGEDACEDYGSQCGNGLTHAEAAAEAPVDAPPCQQQGYGCGYWDDFDAYEYSPPVKKNAEATDRAPGEADAASSTGVDPYDYGYEYDYEYGYDGDLYGQSYKVPVYDSTEDYDCYHEQRHCPAPAHSEGEPSIPADQAQRVLDVTMGVVRGVGEAMRQVQQRLQTFAEIFVQVDTDMAPTESPLAGASRAVSLEKADFAPATGSAYGPEPAGPRFQLLPMPKQLPEFMFPAEHELGW